MISSNNYKSATKPIGIRMWQKFPVVIEGVEAYDLLCPVSSVSGCRENPLSLLKSLVNDPQKSRALDMILQELPSISSPDGLDNDALFEQLQPIFEGTTFYEDDKFAERLLNISSDLLKTVGVDKPVTKVEPSPASDPAPSE